jgi:hypothetical protein
MAVFQTVTFQARESEVAREALNHCVPEHSLGAAIQRYGVRFAPDCPTESEAESYIREKQFKGGPMLAVRIRGTDEWVVGGRFSDDVRP